MCLYTKTKKIICQYFEKFLEEFSDKCDLKIYIPEVVRGEICYQKISQAKEYLNKAKKDLLDVKKTIDKEYEVPFKESDIKGLIEKKFDKWAEKSGINIIKTPYKNISLEKLVQDSIWRNAPFQDVQKIMEISKKCSVEKGFRDSIIMYSVIELSKKIANKIYFVVPDKLFRDTIKDYKKIIVFKSIDDLSSRIRLNLEKDNEDWINNISRRADKVFLNRTWNECKIESKLRVKFKEYIDWPHRNPFFGNIENPYYQYDLSVLGQGEKFQTPDLKLEYSSPGEDKFFYQNTIFKEIKNSNLYIWKSKVLFERDYSESWMANQYPGLKLQIHFKILWSSKVTKDVKFRELKVINTVYLDKRFDYQLPPLPGL